MQTAISLPGQANLPLSLEKRKNMEPGVQLSKSRTMEKPSKSIDSSVSTTEANIRQIKNKNHSHSLLEDENHDHDNGNKNSIKRNSNIHKDKITVAQKPTTESNGKTQKTQKAKKRTRGDLYSSISLC